MTNDKQKCPHAVEIPSNERTPDAQRFHAYMKRLLDSEFCYAFLLDRDGNVLYYSENFPRLAKLDDGCSLIGKPILDACRLFSDETALLEGVPRRLARVQSGETDFCVDDTLVGPDGTRRIYRVTHKRLTDEQGNLDAIFVFAHDITELRRKDAELRLHNLLHSTLLPCMAWDGQGKVVAYNHETSRVFGIPRGLSPDEFHDRFMSLLPPTQSDGRKTADIRQDAMHEALKNGFAQVAIQLAKPDGTPLHFTVNLTRIAWMHEHRLIVYYYDKTDIVRKETEAREAEERIKLMLEATPLGCSFWDERCMVVDCNEVSAKIFNLPDKQAFIDNFYCLSPECQPDGQPSSVKAVRYVKEALEKGQVVFEWMHQTLDGEPIPVEVTLVRLKRENQSTRTNYVVVGYVRDLREVKRMQAETNEINERIKLMLDCNPLICVLQDDRGNIIDCNREALAIFGVASKSEFCKNFYSYFPEYQPDGVRSSDRRATIMRALEEQGTVTLERTFRTPAGELIPVESRIVRIPWKDTYYHLSFSRDLREAKANEQKMREAAELQRRAEVQREAAQTANEAKGRFLANMSHEIRTPMNAILGIAELLLQENLNRRQLQYAGDIKTSAMALLDVVNDILDVSKLQAGKLNLVPVHYDFSLLVDSVSSIAHSLAAEKKIAFRLVMQDPAPACLYGDDVRLRQMLLNLLGNAIKFTDKGHVKLSITFTDTAVNILVSDTGIGIPPENLPTLFDAFEQADAEKNRGRKGTGLGLTIVKSIVDMMGGHIAVESVYGQGTSFRVEIPKIPGDATLIHRPDTGEASLYAPTAKILIVDDNLVNLNVAAGLIRLCAITVDTATSGQQAIERLQQNHYDMVFMDHRMPGMDGVETTQHIRALGITVPIIALTASVVMGAREHMLDAGMDDYLSKPIIMADLNRMLKRWLPAHKLQDPPPKTVAVPRADTEKIEEFWQKIEQIEGLSVATGLSRVDGRRDVYEKTLRLLSKEIDKCDRNLREFLRAGDLRNFCIEVHGMKSSLANVGVMALAARARELEITSGKADIDFCMANLPSFLNELNQLHAKLKDALSAVQPREDRVRIPPELLPILENLTAAFAEMDLVSIDADMEKLNAMRLRGALREDIEHVKDAIMMMDYDTAADHIRKLLDDA